MFDSVIAAFSVIGVFIGQFTTFEASLFGWAFILGSTVAFAEFEGLSSFRSPEETEP